MEQKAAAINAKLRQLWKGTLYVGIVGIYLSTLGIHLFRSGWGSAAIVMFFIALVQLFRYIANDVDRLGWIMREDELTNEQKKVKQYQSSMYAFLFSLMQFANLGIVYFSLDLSNNIAGFIAGGLVITEVIFNVIRNVNRTIDYERASYGIKDASPVFHGPDYQTAYTDYDQPEEKIETYEEKSDKKIAKLQAMVDKGLISQKAFEEARDKEIVERIMSGLV